MPVERHGAAPDGQAFAPGPSWEPGAKACRGGRAAVDPGAYEVMAGNRLRNGSAVTAMPRL
ncbi:hypothetical protein SAMN05428944_1313 [Streptomyces sp. 1222.5]|nr:hypothetical protein BX260_6781 [Streptomyces sp. 5112.2]SEB78254.1 hypothetical protein SAMN05428944_1313 [Streptomyces sp. 1222.5]SEE12274.1 hypothetical protein SAMN05216532_7010 [Streptomyces sp. 2231.1]